MWKRKAREWLSPSSKLAWFTVPLILVFGFVFFSAQNYLQTPAAYHAGDSRLTAAEEIDTGLHESKFTGDSRLPALVTTDEEIDKGLHESNVTGDSRLAAAAEEIDMGLHEDNVTGDSRPLLISPEVGDDSERQKGIIISSDDSEDSRQPIKRYSKMKIIEAGLARARASISRGGGAQTKDDDDVPVGPIYSNASFFHRCGSIKNVMALFEKMRVRDAFTWNEMIIAYMESGLVDLAVELFNRLPEKNAVLYNALLAGLCQNGEGLKAMSLFSRMVRERIEFSDFTLTSLANACGLLMERKSSQQIHGFILKSGCEPNDFIEAALLDMCTRCGRMEDAEKIFRRLPAEHDRLIAFTSMLRGYAQNGQPENAISLFLETQLEGLLVVDGVASATVIGVCGTLGLLKLGKNLYCHALKHGFLSDVVVGNAIISMYAKCGELEDAVKAFELMPSRDLCSWNSLLAGYVLHRRGDEALDTWLKMERLGIVPDSFTCLHIISAYKHTTINLVNRCQTFFSSMQSAYGVVPTSEHYACFVSVLGYWGMLEEAEETINHMPFEPKPSVWRALLDSCIVHMNSAIGKRVIKKILSIEPQDPSTFILKSNLYSASGRWQCSELVRAEMREKGFQKIPGQSWIICQNKLHSFFARDKSHLQSKDIYSGLDILILACMKAGYVPDTSYVLHEVEEYQKKEFLFHHSAKLALTYGLLLTKPGKPVQVMKNILLCGDCHTFFKFVSIVTKREIHVRDTSGFHCFCNGICSCNDRW